MAAQHHTPWLSALDGSLDAYLGAGERALAKV